MFAVRVPVKSITPKEIVRSIDNFLLDFKTELERGFTGGKQKPELDRYNHLAIFQQLSTFFDSIPLEYIGSVNDVHKYFNQIEQGLEVNMKSWSMDDQLVVPENMIKMYVAIIGIYREFTKFKFSFSHLPEDVVGQFESEIKKIKLTYQSIEIILTDANKNKMNESLSSFDKIISYTMKTLSEKGYGKLDLDFEKSVSLEREDSFYLDLKNELNSLATSNELNEHIKKFHEGTSQESEVSKTEINLALLRMEQVRVRVTELTKNFDLHKNELSVLSEKFVIISTQLDNVKEFLKPYLALSKTVLSIQGYKSSEQEIKGYIGLEEALKNFDNVVANIGLDVSQWKTVNAFVKDKSSLITDSIKKFLPPLQSFLLAASEFRQRDTELRLKSEQLQSSLVKYEVNMSKAKGILLKSCDLIEENQLVLAKHLETNLDYVKSFVKKNWGKMGIGSGGGGGVALVITYLLGLSTPIGAIVVTISVLFGLSSGIGVGVAKEAHDEKKAKEGENLPQVEIVSNDKNKKQTPELIDVPTETSTLLSKKETAVKKYDSNSNQDGKPKWARSSLTIWSNEKEVLTISDVVAQDKLTNQIKQTKQ